MATQLESEPEVGVSTLIGGIVQDARQLLVEQMNLFQVEVKNDMRRTVAAMVPIMAGVGVVLAAMFLLGMGAAHLLNTIVPEFPLWGAYLAVGAFVALLGGGLIFLGRSMFAAFNPLPDQTLKGLKENLQWETKK